MNLLSQRYVLNTLDHDNKFFIAILIGTFIGLFTKYFLDKKYIFYDAERSIKNNSKKFYRYSLNGIFTTIIFWTTESLFYFIYNSDFARELGAIIGLSIGYFLKYRLDKKYVFQGTK